MTVLLIIHLIMTLSLIGVILLQHSEGGLGSMSGQNSLFTARGGSNVLTKATWVLASLFIGNCLLMTFLSSHNVKRSTLFLENNSSSSKVKPAQSEPAQSKHVKAESKDAPSAPQPPQNQNKK